jgi:hypothetical protein
MIRLEVSEILSKNCGGYGAWMGNVLSSPAPGSETWAGFQIGGGRKSRRSHKRRKYSKYRKSIKHGSRRSRRSRRRMN